MKIECFLSENCGSYHELSANIDQALSELKVNAEVVYRTVSYEEALQLGIKGSPTVRINGKDIEDSGSPGLI